MCTRFHSYSVWWFMSVCPLHRVELCISKLTCHCRNQWGCPDHCGYVDHVPTRILTYSMNGTTSHLICVHTQSTLFVNIKMDALAQTPPDEIVICTLKKWIAVLSPVNCTIRTPSLNCLQHDWKCLFP